MMPKNTLIAALLPVLVAGCASPSPHFDSRFGHAVKAAQAQQILNPEASRNADPVAGIGGAPADSAVKEYQRSFTSPEPTFPVINVGVGGSR